MTLIEFLEARVAHLEACAAFPARDGDHPDVRRVLDSHAESARVWRNALTQTATFDEPEPALILMARHWRWHPDFDPEWLA